MVSEKLNELNENKVWNMQEKSQLNVSGTEMSSFGCKRTRCDVQNVLPPNMS